MRVPNVVKSLGWLSLALGLALPLNAKSLKSEEQWAQCLWAHVPQSSSNWLATTSERSHLFSEKKTVNEMLEYRLQAACYKELTPVGEIEPVKFSANKVRAALRSSKPAAIEADKVDPKPFFCVRYFVDDVRFEYPAEYSWGFGDSEDFHLFDRIDTTYRRSDGTAVALDKQAGLRKCQRIGNDGTLTDA